jgi:hypothetical protein
MNTRLVACSFVLLPIAACGSSGSAAPPATAQPTVTITEANAIEVGRAADGMFDLVTIARIAARIVEKGPPEPALLPAATTAPGVVVQTFPGPQGGEAVFTWRDLGGEHYSTGDTFDVQFTEYVDGPLTLTGTVAFDGVEIVGDVVDGFAWTLTARITFVGLHAAGERLDTVLDASMPLLREQRATVTLLTLVADGDVAYDGRILQAGSMLARNDYLIDFSMALFAEATIVDPALGGALTFETETPLTGVQVMPDPWAGSLTVHGAAESVMDVAAVDLFNVELKIDLEGDEVIDFIVPVEWATL